MSLEFYQEWIAPKDCKPMSKKDLVIAKNMLQNNSLANIPFGQEKENTMDMNMEVGQRRYLTDRLWSIKDQKRADLRQAFFIDDMDAPRSFDELQARLKAGMYLIKDENTAKKGYGPLDYIQWRDPKKPADQAGYEAAKQKLEEAYSAAVDLAKIAPLADGLKALQDLKAASFQ